MKCEVISRQWCGMDRGSIVVASENDLKMYPHDLKPLEAPKPKEKPEPKHEPKKNSFFAKKKKQEDDE